MSQAPSQTPTPAAPSPDRKALPLAEIEAAIQSVRFGIVQIVIQDGVVVQIDKTEKLRLR